VLNIEVLWLRLGEHFLYLFYMHKLLYYKTKIAYVADTDI